MSKVPPKYAGYLSVWAKGNTTYTHGLVGFGERRRDETKKKQNKK